MYPSPSFYKDLDLHCNFFGPNTSLSIGVGALGHAPGQDLGFRAYGLSVCWTMLTEFEHGTPQTRNPRKHLTIGI